MKRILLLLALMVSPAPLYAQDAELYDPKPPADSAFVRVANGYGAASEATSAVGSAQFGGVAYGALTDYHILKAGQHEATLGSAKSTLDIQAGHYYTVALTSAQQIVLFDEALLENPAKAKIYFFNLSDTAASLYAPGFKADIVKDIASNKYQAKDINAVTFKVEVRAAGVSIKTFDEVALTRRNAVSVLLTGSKDRLSATLVANRVAK